MPEKRPLKRMQRKVAQWVEILAILRCWDENPLVLWVVCRQVGLISSMFNGNVHEFHCFSEGSPGVGGSNLADGCFDLQPDWLDLIPKGLGSFCVYPYQFLTQKVTVWMTVLFPSTMWLLSWGDVF